LQACWTWESEEGSKTSLQDLATKWIALDESTRCEPDSKAVAFYQELQKFHDQLASTLTDTFKTKIQTP